MDYITELTRLEKELEVSKDLETNMDLQDQIRNLKIQHGVIEANENPYGPIECFGCGA